jgi:hypothetical protein
MPLVRLPHHTHPIPGDKSMKAGKGTQAGMGPIRAVSTWALALGTILAPLAAHAAPPIRRRQAWARRRPSMCMRAPPIPSPSPPMGNGWPSTCRAACGSSRPKAGKPDASPTISTMPICPSGRQMARASPITPIATATMICGPCAPMAATRASSPMARMTTAIRPGRPTARPSPSPPTATAAMTSGRWMSPAAPPARSPEARARTAPHMER